jgi:hypothetical protein
MLGCGAGGDNLRGGMMAILGRHVHQFLPTDRTEFLETRGRNYKEFYDMFSLFRKVKIKANTKLERLKFVKIRITPTE